MALDSWSIVVGCTAALYYFYLGGEVEMNQVSDQTNEVLSNNLRQRSSLTETRITLRLVTQERTRMVCVSENSTLEDLKRFDYSLLLYN